MTREGSAKEANGLAAYKDVSRSPSPRMSRNRSPSKMTKYVECWGADKPFANITESTLAKNIGLTVSDYHCNVKWRTLIRVITTH